MKLPSHNQYHKKWAESKGVKELKIVTPHLTNSRVCLDIGAHIGATAIKYSKIFDTVYSFEPTSYLYDLLEENTKDFKNIISFNVAVSNADGKVQIYENNKNSESNVVVHDDTLPLIKSRLGNKFSAEPKEVTSKAIDNYKFDNVDFIKIDVERYTIPVIEGMIKTLENNSPVIQVEVEDVASITSRTQKLLNTLGYQVYHKSKYDWFYKK